MKKILAVLIVVLLLTSCADTSGLDSEAPSDVVSSPESMAEPEPPSSTEESAQDPVNSALTEIQGFDSLPEDALLGVRYYRMDVAWMEINQLANLERYQPMEPDYNYFLIIPRYVGANVRVETMLFDESTSEWKAGEITYQKENIPDGYALLINDIMPEGGPHKRVVVTYQGESGSCDFTVDNYSGEHPAPWYKDRAYMIDPSEEDVPVIADRVHPVETVADIPERDLPPETLAAETPYQYPLDEDHTLVFTEGEGLGSFALYEGSGLNAWLAFDMDQHTRYSLLYEEFVSPLGQPEVSFDLGTQTATLQNKKLRYELSFERGEVSVQYLYTDSLIPIVDQMDQQGNLYSDKMVLDTSEDGRYYIYGGDRFGMGDYGEFDLVLKDQTTGAMTFLCNVEASGQALFGKDGEILVNQIDALCKIDLASGEIIDPAFAIDCVEKDCFITGIAYDSVKDWYLVTWRTPKQPESDTCPIWLDVYESNGTLVKSINSEVNVIPWHINWVPSYELTPDGSGTVEIENSFRRNEQDIFPIRIFYW